eukprot:s1345_g6.t1
MPQMGVTLPQAPLLVAGPTFRKDRYSPGSSKMIAKSHQLHIMSSQWEFIVGLWVCSSIFVSSSSLALVTNQHRVKHISDMVKAVILDHD